MNRIVDAVLNYPVSMIGLDDILLVKQALINPDPSYIYVICQFITLCIRKSGALCSPVNIFRPCDT